MRPCKRVVWEISEGILWRKGFHNCWNASECMGNNWRGRDGIRMYCKVRFRSENSGPHTANTYRHHIAHRNVSNQPRTVTTLTVGQIQCGMAPICEIYGHVPAPNKNHPKEISNKNHRAQGGGEVKYGSDPSVPPAMYPTDLPTLSPACLLGPTLLERCLTTG